MSEYKEYSICTDAQLTLKKAREDGVETAWDRLKKQEPQCGYCELGVSCRICVMGPCRIDPFGEGPQRGVCGADADIIVASDFPDLVKKYKVTTLPTTIFGENLFMEGHVAESEFLEMIFQAEGIKPAPDRRCLVCGNSTPDAICEQCKTRIRAEALDHKLKSERTKQGESS